MWNLKNNTNELISKQKETHRYKKEIYGAKRERDKLGVWD